MHECILCLIPGLGSRVAHRMAVQGSLSICDLNFFEQCRKAFLKDPLTKAEPGACGGYIPGLRSVTRHSHDGISVAFIALRR